MFTAMLAWKSLWNREPCFVSGRDEEVISTNECVGHLRHTVQP